MVKTRHQSGLNVFPSLTFSPCKMKTRSRRSNALDDEKDTDSDDSLYTNCFPKRRKKRIGPKLGEHMSKYNREISIDMQGAQYPVKRHLSLKVESEGQTSTKVEKLGAMSPIPSHPSSNQIYVNGDDTVEKRSVRRSTRQRKFIYDNLNQTWLLASSIPEFSKLEPLFSAGQRPEQEPQCVTLRPRRSEQTRNYELRRLGLSTAELEFEDMYSRVKRKRRKNVHGFYSRRVSQDVGSMADTEETDQNEISDSESVDDVGSDLEEGSRIGGEELQEEVAVNSKYCLRPKKPITERFQFPIEPVRPKRSAAVNLFDTTTDHQPSSERESFKSSAHRSPLFRRKRHAIHNSSSTSSSSDDERRFERKKARSMARARNRCLPLNFKEDDLSKGVLRDRGKIGSSLADIDPMSIDKTVSFDSVGGLDHHIQSLKEMILFPLMYPEVFERFKIAPPRGVLFHGPPGTGKTLVARALANECSHGDRRVAFFMRKGADCLSKWVGESERQLRLLFDQAYSMRPSIIFFDEIDGLAPVRSTRQDQIHSSIVSTLLALMDGLDNRGEIVIIGATNRIDAIDPALRRPGRFDRELLFPLPSLEAREKILKINIQQWNPPLPDGFILALAARSSGYCGADLKALCTEAALVALRRRYPQIYGSRQKLQLDVNTIQVTAQDFMKAMKQMVPAAQRSASFSANPLSIILKPLMERMLKNAMNKLKKVFPLSLQTKEYREETNYSPARNTSALENDASSEESDSSLFQSEAMASENSDVQYTADSLKLTDTVFRQFRFSRYLWPFVHRPRFLLFGAKGQGQGSLAPAILYNLEHVPVHRLDIPALYAVTCRSPEEACALIFQEALRKIPSIIFLPHIGYWWETLTETVRATFLSLLQDLEPCTPLMLLATSDCLFDQLPQEVRDIFSVSEDQIMQMDNPNEEERKLFFSVLLKDIYIKPRKKTSKRSFEALPIAPLPETRKLTAAELEKLRRSEEATMRELRLFLRDILNKLARDRRFAVFSRPVDPVEVPDYQEVIKNPMDLETMRTKIDLHQYETVAGFLADIDLICHNALEYNPDIDPSDKLIRHRACALKDTAHALVLSELDTEFEKICHEIHIARQKRGESPSKYVPRNYHVLPRIHLPTSKSSNSSGVQKVFCKIPENEDKINSIEDISISNSCPTRFSKRLRGMGAASPPSNFESIKKTKIFTAPKRTTRYMVWRRKKSPWFGCHRFIRRRIKYPKDISREKIRKCTNVLQCKVSNSLSPVPEIDIPDMQKTSILNPLDNNEGYIKETQAQEAAANESLPDTFRAISNNTENVQGGSPEIVFVSAVKDQLDQNLKHSTSRFNTAICCDTSQDSNCSKDTSISSLSTNTSEDIPDIRCNKIGTEEEKQELLNPSETGAKLCDNFTADQENWISRQEIEIDRNLMQNILDKLVKVTEDCTVDTLQQLFSILQQCIYRHRREWDKHNLILELEKEIQRFHRHSLS